MAENEKIQELLKQIHELAAELEKSRQELKRLYNEVRILSGENINPTRLAETQKRRQESFSLENFVGLRLIHFIGIIALVIGLAIGVKYAIDRNLVSPLMRIGLAYLAAAILFFISFRLRKKYRLFSLILFGGSMATAYFTTYGAFAYYQFLTIAVTFGLMLLLAVVTVYYSIKYNSQELSVLALVGGYGIPFLVRGNAENWIGLFSYIFIINLAISFLSFKRYWTTLIYLSFAVTWIIFLSSLYLRFEKIGFAPALLFSILFFLLFMVNTTAFKFRRKEQLTWPDTLIVLINITLFYFALWRIFNFDDFEQLSVMTILFGVASLGTGLLEKFLHQSTLAKGFLLFGLLMVIISIPMRFEQLTITIIWMFMATLLFVIGLWKKTKLFRLVAIVLFAATLFKLVAIDSMKFTAIQKVISYILLGTILLTISFLYQKFKDVIFRDDEPDPNNF